MIGNDIYKVSRPTVKSIYGVFKSVSPIQDSTTNKNQEKLKSISVIIQNILDNMILFIVSFINIPILIPRQRWL